MQGDVLNAEQFEEDREPLEDASAFSDALNDPGVFNEHAAARVPEDGAVQSPQALNDLLDEALTPGPELEEDIPRRRFLSGPRKGSSVKGRKLLKPEDAKKVSFNPQQRLLLLDTWRRSGLPAGDLASLVGISKHTLYAWKKAFDVQGPAGLMRGPALPACPSTVARVLKEAGYETVDESTRPHPDKVRSFERATPNQLWQSDLFTFVLKRQNRCGIEI